MKSAGLLGRVPPHNEDVERAVLGSTLLSEDALDKALDILRPADFYKTAHQLIFEAIQLLRNNETNIDIISLVDTLRQQNNLDRVGGSPYIASLTTDLPTTANVEYYSKIIRSNSFRRSLITISSELTAKAYDESEDTQELIAEAEKKIFEILDNSSMGSKYTSIGPVVTETMNFIEKLYHSKGEYTGVPSGFSELDNMTSGFQKSEFIVIGARPSVGKTALAINMATFIAVRKKIPVGFFTLEMSSKSLMQRIISSEAQIDSNSIRSGKLKQSDFGSLADAAGNLYEAPLYIDDTPNINLLDLRSQARRMKKNEQIEILFIDYIGLIEPASKGTIPRHEQVAELSRSLKALARELDIPIVALSQVRRESEGKEPTLSDLRESGSIEQDADVVIFLHRDRLEADNDDDDNVVSYSKNNNKKRKRDPLETSLILAKQRNGPVGTVFIKFQPKYTRFVNLIARNYDKKS